MAHSAGFFEKEKSKKHGKIGVGWAKNAEIKKAEDGKTIALSDGTNLVLLRRNEVKTKVTLRINNAETNKFIAKKKRGKLNIYYVYYNP